MKHIKSKNLPKIDQTIAPQPIAPPPVTTDTVQPGEPSVVTPTFIAPTLPMIDGEEYIDLPNTGMRRTIAKRLTESKVCSSYLNIIF